MTGSRLFECVNCGDSDSRQWFLNEEGLCPKCAGEEDDEIEEDPEVEERKQIMNEVMERHPDFVFTGEQYNSYVYEGDMHPDPVDPPINPWEEY